MSQTSQRFFRLLAVLGIAVLLLGVLFGAVSADSHLGKRSAPVASASANRLLKPTAQGVTGSIQTQPGQPGDANGGATTATTNVNVGIPGLAWIVVVLVLVVIVALIASRSRGGGGSTTV